MFAFRAVAMLGVLLAAPMLIPGPDGKPIMSIDDWIPRDLINSIMQGGKKVSRAVEKAEDNLGTAAQIYSWRDEQGVLHYSDTPVAGAEPVEVQDNTLEIPADRFVQSGLAPAESRKSGSGQAILLEEKRFPRSGGSSNKKATNDDTSLEDLEALANGDYSKAGDVIKNLPELLQQAKEARAAQRDL